MKKLVFILLLMFSALSMHSQTTDSVKIQEPVKYEYCEIVGSKALLSSKIIIEIDFGQKVSLFDQYEKRVLKDDNGEPIKFNSMIDALNYMGTKGWEFVQAYVISELDNPVYHFLMKRDLE